MSQAYSELGVGLIPACSTSDSSYQAGVSLWLFWLPQCLLTVTRTISILEATGPCCQPICSRGLAALAPAIL